ncbi:MULTISPECIES: DUF4192 domain-containing protein [Amycolatopsis]|uniref:DUF4192 domain-containing protein n=1 Tax=Amycolatopsis bullii TaxID=941987 RepID=A0ABQ3KSQ6_9PSEU|nr:DUF4192 domain-containing protein [Amycolatopsis bullii]GHG30213.1 hypothetical protein GCM10017567_57640 [Amycolatopsis bullii]
MPLTPADTSVVVASIPALLCFMPEDSLVLIATLTKDTGSASSGPLARIDLAHLAHDPEGCAQHFNRQCADLPVLCMTGVVVGTDGVDSLPLRADIEAIITALADHGFTDVDIVHVPDIAEGARWRSYRNTNRTGVLPDPAATAAAAAAVTAGHSIADSRATLAARFTPVPEPLRARLHPRIAHATESAAIDESWHLAAHVRLDRADAAIRAAGHGQLPTDEADIIDLAATFAMPAFRDALLALPDHAARLAAENLVLHLWRHSCDPIAGQLATVVAVYSYLRGDGTVARIALEHTDPEQPLASLLSTVLAHAIAPSKVHHVFQNASDDARRTLLSEPATDQA